MIEKDFDELMKAHQGKVQRVAMHPDDVTDLNEGNSVPWTADNPTVFHHDGVSVVLDPSVHKGSVNILKVKEEKKGDIEGPNFTDLDTAYHKHLELFHQKKPGPPNTCPECNKPTYMEGDCLECRVKFQGMAIVNLRKQMDGHFHYIAPSSDGVPESMTTIAQYEVLNKHEAMHMKMADGVHRYVMLLDGEESEEGGTWVEHYSCPNCGHKKSFELTGSMKVDTPLVCVVCTPEKSKCPDCGSQLSFTGFDWFCVNCPWRSSPESEEKTEVPELQIGDLVVRESASGGLDIFVIPPGPTDPKQELDFKCFFNEKGAIALGNWIYELYGRDDLTSPGIGLGPPDDEGFQAFVTMHNHVDIEVHLDTCPGCRVEDGPSKPMVSDEGPGIRIPEVGEHVLYWDNDRIEHEALVTHVWSDTCINLVWIDAHPTALEGQNVPVADTYGYHRKYETSVEHESVVEVHRNCWT